MTASDWDRLKLIFQRALELPADERSRFLDEACAGDAALRREAEALARSHDAAGEFLETPAAAQLPLPAPGGAEDLVGRLVGSFRVVAQIGRGGMGAVYRASREGDDYAQDVALKLVPRGMDSARFLARFRQERRILARLEHPNIARIIDGGTTDDGRPYCAMELVDGKPLDTYCVEQRLGLRPRLELFRRVCDAVTYAHRSLVVHRDLKPGNILVTADGVPKLLDFGIAKLLSADDAEEPGLTETGVFLMTPEYASPEQVRGIPVTTATDIYALGVLLYVLLTDRRPYELTTRSAEEIVRVVCEEQPRPPSVVAAAAAGTDAHAGPAGPRWRVDSDLDTIALKAVRKEPERRYASAADLSEDVRRYLAGLPVLARPDTVRYRTSRFVTRHRGAVAAAALAVLSLIGGLGATMYQARIAEANRQRAERRFQDVRRIANSLVFELHDSIADVAGATAARALVLRRASELLNTLAADAPSDPVLGEEVAEAYHRLGEALGSGSESNLGNRQASLEAHRKGLAVRAQLAAAAPADADRQDALASSHISLSYALDDVGRSLEEAKTAVAIASRNASARPQRAGYQRRLANAWFAQGAHTVATGSMAEAAEAFAQAAAVYDRLLAREPDDPNLLRNATLAHKRIGAILTKQRRFPEALAHYRQAVAADEARVAREPASPGARYDLSVSLVDLGTMLGASGDWSGQIQHCTRALALREELSREDPNDARAKLGLVSVLGRLAVGSRELRRYDDALAFLRRGLPLSAPTAAGASNTGFFLVLLAQVRIDLGQWNEAVRQADDAAGHYLRMAAQQPNNSWVAIGTASATALRGDALAGRALQPGRSAVSKPADLNAAAAAYRSALSQFADLEKRGLLVGADAELPDKARSGLERCERALSGRSETPASPPSPARS